MGLNPRLSEYIQQAKLTTYDMDANNILRPSAMLRYCQEARKLHLACCGLTHEKMQGDGIISVSTRTGGVVHRWSRQHDPITTITWVCEVVGVQFYRSFDFYCGNEHLAEVLQASAAVSTQEYELLRPKVSLDYGVGAGGNSGQKLDRMNLPEEMSIVGEREVRYSDLDYNGYVSSSVYNDIFCDYVPGGIHGRALRGFQIHYVMESRGGKMPQTQREERGGQTLMRGMNPRGISSEYQGRVERSPDQKTGA